MADNSKFHVKLDQLEQRVEQLAKQIEQIPLMMMRALEESARKSREQAKLDRARRESQLTKNWCGHPKEHAERGTCCSATEQGMCGAKVPLELHEMTPQEVDAYLEEHDLHCPTCACNEPDPFDEGFEAGLKHAGWGGTQ